MKLFLRIVRPVLGGMISLSLLLTGPLAPLAQAKTEENKGNYWASRRTKMHPLISTQGSSRSFFASQSYAQPDKFENPRSEALCREQFWPLIGRRGWRVEGKTLPFVTQIEDNHGDIPSQLAAVTLLDKVDSERGNEPLLIGSEGAWGPLDLSFLLTLPAGEGKNRWLNHLLWKGNLTGEEYWVLTRSPSNVSLVGIDDPVLHAQHTKARRAVVISRAKTKVFLDEATRRLEKLKNIHFSSSMLTLDTDFSKYEKGDISVIDLSIRLLKRCPTDWMAEYTPHLYRLGQISQNTVRPEEVRKELEEFLSLRLSPLESKTLFSDVRSKGMEDTFDKISMMAETKGIHLPLTRCYARQKGLSKDIDVVSLSKEVDQAKELLFSQFLPGESTALKLFQASRDLSLIRGSIDLKLTPTDWERAQASGLLLDSKKVFEGIRSVEKQSGLTKCLPAPPASFDHVLANAKLFYEIAILRDRAMVDNLIREAGRVGALRTVLVAGGFHTPGMTLLYRNGGVPFEAFCPIPKTHAGTTLRDMDTFQDPETRRTILVDTARNLLSQGETDFMTWVHRLPRKDRRTLSEEGVLNPHWLITLGVAVRSTLARWFFRIMEFLVRAWKFYSYYRDLRTATPRTSWFVFTPSYLLPQSRHRAPAEHGPDLPLKEPGTEETKTIQKYVNQSRWQELENFLFQIGAGRGSCRLVGQAIMEIQLQGKTPEETRRHLAEHLNPRTLGLIGQGLVDYFQFRDLERLYALRKLNIEYNQAISRGPAEITSALTRIRDNLLEEASELLGGEERDPETVGLDPMDPDTQLVTTKVLSDANLTRSLATRIEAYLTHTQTGANTEEAKAIKTKIAEHYRREIKEIILPSVEGTQRDIAQARAKLPAHRVWRLMTLSQETDKRRLAKESWRSNGATHQLTIKGVLFDPLGFKRPTKPSLFGGISENQALIKKVQANLAEQNRPLAAVSLPYTESKEHLLRDLALSMADSPHNNPGPKKLLCVRLGLLGDTPESRMKGLNDLFAQIGAVGSTVIAIDLDEVGFLIDKGEKPIEHLLLTWKKLPTPPPLVFLSAGRSHLEHLNTGTDDSAPVTSFSPGRTNAEAILREEVARIETAADCEIDSTVVEALADTIFSSGTVDLSEAIKALRWAAGEVLVRSVAEGTKPVITPQDIHLAGDVPLRELPLARQVRTVVARVEDTFAQSLNSLLSQFESLDPMSPFYPSIETRLRHAVGLWHVFLKKENIPAAKKLTDSEIDEGIDRAWKFFNGRMFGLYPQKRKVIDTYVRHDLEQIGNPDPAPSNILCLIGPPSTGKTELADALARFSNTRLIKIDAGGESSDEIIKGTLSTYVGSEPGIIQKALEEEETDDIVILIDEIEKGSPKFLNSLIQLLEKNQPIESRYDTFKIKKRRIKIICTGNVKENIPAVLQSRMEFVEFRNYTPHELKRTALFFLWQKVQQRFKFSESEVRFENIAQIVSILVDDYLDRPDLRELYRLIDRLHQAANLVIHNIDDHRFLPVVVDEAFVRELFGPPLARPQQIVRGDTPGQNMGLAVMGTGVGALLPVQAVALPLELVQSRRFVVTGAAAETMRASVEHIMPALETYREEHPDDFEDIPPFSEIALHLHLPPMLLPKDGPSAGLAMGVAAYSEITQRQISPNIAMTGELGNGGGVMPVGGIPEKIQVARNNNFTTIFIPSANESDLKSGYLENVFQEEAPVAIQSQDQTTYFFNGKVKQTTDQIHVGTVGFNKTDINATQVKSGVYITLKNGVSMPSSIQPCFTVVLVGHIKEAITYPGALQQTGVILPNPTKEAAPLLDGRPPRDEGKGDGANRSKDQKKDAASLPIPDTPPQEKFVPKNVYNRSTSTVLTLTKDTTTHLHEFLNADREGQSVILTALLMQGTEEGLALFEVYMRALWIVNPVEAGIHYSDYVTHTPSFFSPPHMDIGVVGIPFLAPMVSVQGEIAVDSFLEDIPSQIDLLNDAIESAQIWDSSVESDIQFVLEDLIRAQAELIAVQKHSSGQAMKLSAFWENRIGRLTVLAKGMKSLVDRPEVTNRVSPGFHSRLNSLVGQGEANISHTSSMDDGALLKYILRQALLYLEAETQFAQEHRFAPFRGSQEHPVLRSIKEQKNTESLGIMADQLTRKTQLGGRHLGGEAARLMESYFAIDWIEYGIRVGPIVDHSRYGSKQREDINTSLLEWVQPAANGVATAISGTGQRILTIVSPSKVRREELPGRVAKNLSSRTDLPLHAKTQRVLSLNFPNIPTIDSSQDIKLIQNWVQRARATENAVLFIDLPSFKTWAGSHYFKHLRRIIEIANSERSRHPPLCLVFGSDTDTYTQTNSTVDTFGSLSQTVRLNDPSKEEILALIKLRADKAAKATNPVQFSESLWETSMNEGRIPTNLDECVAIFDSIVASAILEEKTVVDREFLDSFINHRQKQEKLVDSLVRRAEKEVPNIPDGAAKRHGEEYLARLKTYQTGAPEAIITSQYLEWLLKWDWKPAPSPKLTHEDILILKNRAIEVMDKRLFGQPELKKRVLEMYLAYLREIQLGHTPQLPVIALTGPFESGKTTAGQMIADVFNIVFKKFDMAAESDPRRIKGFEPYVLGSEPGIIYQLTTEAHQQAKAELEDPQKNPTEVHEQGKAVILIDEFEKAEPSQNGDPRSALHPHLDPEHQGNVGDTYLGHPVDYRNTMFIITMNFPDMIPASLRSRMEIIEVPRLVEEEQVQLGAQILLSQIAQEKNIVLVGEGNPSADGHPESFRILDFGSSEDRVALFQELNSGWVRAGPRDLGRVISQLLDAAVEENAEIEREPGTPAQALVVRAADLTRLLGTRPLTADSRKSALTTQPGPGETMFLGEDGKAGGVSVWNKETPGVSGSFHWSRGAVEQRTLNQGEINTIQKTREILHIVWTLALKRFPRQLFGHRFTVDFFGASPGRNSEEGLATFMAFVSRALKRAISRDTVFIGELEATGKIQPTGNDLERRILRARSDGFLNFHFNSRTDELRRLMIKHPRLAGVIVSGKRVSLCIPQGNMADVPAEVDPIGATHRKALHDTIPPGIIEKTIWSKDVTASILAEASRQGHGVDSASLSGLTIISVDSVDTALALLASANIERTSVPIYYLSDTVDSVLKHTGFPKDPPMGSLKDGQGGIFLVTFSILLVGLVFILGGQLDGILTLSSLASHPVAPLTEWTLSSFHHGFIETSLSLVFLIINNLIQAHFSAKEDRHPRLSALLLFAEGLTQEGQTALKELVFKNNEVEIELSTLTDEQITKIHLFASNSPLGELKSFVAWENSKKAILESCELEMKRRGKKLPETLSEERFELVPSPRSQLGGIIRYQTEARIRNSQS